MKGNNIGKIRTKHVTESSQKKLRHIQIRSQLFTYKMFYSWQMHRSFTRAFYDAITNHLVFKLKIKN